MFHAKNKLSAAVLADLKCIVIKDFFFNDCLVNFQELGDFTHDSLLEVFTFKVLICKYCPIGKFCKSQDWSGDFEIPLWTKLNPKS